MFRLWSPTFEPVRDVPLKETPVGYPALALRAVAWEGGQVVCGSALGEVLELSVLPLGDGSCVMIPTFPLLLLFFL